MEFYIKYSSCKVQHIYNALNPLIEVKHVITNATSGIKYVPSDGVVYVMDLTSNKWYINVTIQMLNYIPFVSRSIIAMKMT